MEKRIVIPLCLVISLCLVLPGAAQAAGVQTTTTTAISAELQANQSIEQANAMIANVSGLINEFTAGDGLSVTDPRLVPIIQLRDLAAKFISNSNDLYANGAYPSARDSAGEGLKSANEAWTLSLTLKAELSKPPAQTGAVTSSSTPTTGNAPATTNAPAVTTTAVSGTNAVVPGGNDLLSQIISAFQRFLKLFGI
jgi:hypothetical protein